MATIFLVGAVFFLGAEEIVVVLYAVDFVLVDFLGAEYPVFRGAAFTVTFLVAPEGFNGTAVAVIVDFPEGGTITDFGWSTVCPPSPLFMKAYRAAPPAANRAINVVTGICPHSRRDYPLLRS